jgi:hypothetical protein
MVQTSFARKTNSCAALLCCGGPSLSSVNPRYLNGHNRLVFALNNTYPFVKPDVWIGMDDPECYHRDIFWQPFVKIMRGGYQNRLCESENISHLHNMFYADVEKVDSQEETFKRRAHASRFVWHGNTLATALHIIIWMGCKEIYLFGCDLDNSGKDYFNNTTLAPFHKRRNQTLHDELFLYLKWFSEVGKLRHGVELYSCSPSSKINSFLPFVSYLDLIKTREKDLSYGKKLVHSVDAEPGQIIGLDLGKADTMK